MAEAGFFELLEQYPAFLYFSVALLGLVVGSFINVVILRLPEMMLRAWRHEARDILGHDPTPDADDFNLVTPRSRCPSCGHLIRWYENIPLISWLVLRGRCSACGTHISARYPVIELSAAILALLVAWQLEYGAWMLAVIIASWVLLALAMIDFDTTLLPDSITYPFLWVGLLLALADISPVSLQDAVIGAIAGYMALWTIYWTFKLLTGKEGMGHGDFKLLAGLGAWLGWQLLPTIILLSSLVGAVIGTIMLVTGAVKRDQGMPFGPYLAGAGWLCLVFGDHIKGLLGARS